METRNAASHLTPQEVNSQLASVDILSINVIQAISQILDHCMPTVPSGFYILSIVLKHLQRLCSHNLDTNGNNILPVSLCNLLKKCLHSVANICDSEKFDTLWNTFSQTLQKCAKGCRQVCNVVVEVLSQPLLDLALCTSNTFSWQQKREFLRLLRELLSAADRTLNQKVGHSLDQHLCKLTELFLTCGDYEYQASIMEVIFRYISIYRSRKSLKHWFNGLVPVFVAFSSIKFLEFDVDCRQFINIANESLGNDRKVYSFACLQAYLGDIELQKPRDDKYKQFWIDFNKGSKTVSFYCEGNQPLEDSHTSKGSWKLIVIHREMVKSAKLYKRNDVRSSSTGHCTVVIEFVKHDGNDDISNSILSQSHLKFFFDHIHHLSLSKDVLRPLFEEAFQELNSAKVTSYRSSVSYLIPVTLSRTPRNRDCNKRVKVSVGEMTPLNNRRKFEPLIIKKSIKHHIKEVPSAGSGQHCSLPFAQLDQDVSHTNDEVQDTQSSDPAKDLKGKLTEQYIEKFSKRKVTLAVSPQLSHVSEERLTEMGSTSCSLQSAQENYNSSLNKSKNKYQKVSVNTQQSVIETKSRELPVEQFSEDSGKAFESIKVHAEKGFSSTSLKRSPKVLLKKLHFNETSVSCPSYNDAIKYKSQLTKTTSVYGEQTELKSKGSESLIDKGAITKSLCNNLVESNDFKSINIKKAPDDTASLISNNDADHSHLQNTIQMSKAPKLKSSVNITVNKSFKSVEANSSSDSDLFFQDETSRKQNTTLQNVHKLKNTVGGATPIDSLEEQLKVLPKSNHIMQPDSPKSSEHVTMQKEVDCNDKSLVPPSDLTATKNSNISRVNVNLITETQQTLIMVNSCKENETGMKKQQRSCSALQFDNNQQIATEEIEIKNREILRQRSHNLRKGTSPNEFTVTILDNEQKSKNNFTGNSETNVVNKSSVLVSETSEALLADWEDNLDDGISSKELYAAPCIKTSVQGNITQGKHLNEEKLEINRVTNRTFAGEKNNLQNESKITKKESYNDHLSKTHKVAEASVEKRSSKKYFKDFSCQKKKLIIATHSKSNLNDSSKVESSKCIKKDNVKSNNVTEIVTVDASLDVPKLGKPNRLSKKRKLYTHNDSSVVINPQDFDDSNDTINDSHYGFKFARKKQRKSMLASKQRHRSRALEGGIFSIENLEDSDNNANEDKHNSLNSFRQSFQLQFTMDKGYNRWYTKYKEECLQKYRNKQNKRSVKGLKETSVYSDIDSEDSTLSWLPPTDEKKSKKRNEKLLEHLNRTARKYERKKLSSKTFKISSHSFTFANNKTNVNDPKSTSNENILKVESYAKDFFRNRKITSLMQEHQDFDTVSGKLPGNSVTNSSSEDDDKHLRNMPLSMRLSHDNKALNKIKLHKQMSNNTSESKKNDTEKTKSCEKLQERSKKCGIIKILDLQKDDLKLASAEDNHGYVQNEISSHSQMKSAFPSSYSENKMEGAEEETARNEKTESLSRGNGYKQNLSSRNSPKETYPQTIELTDDKRDYDKKESFASIEKKYNDKDSNSSESSESIFENRMKKKAADKLKSYKNKQYLRPKDPDSSAVDDLHPSNSTSHAKTAKGRKNHSKHKPEVRSSSLNSLSQEKIVEEAKEIHWSNESSISNTRKSSYLTKKRKMKVKNKKKHNMKSPNTSDPESGCSSEEQEKIKRRQTTTERDEGITQIKNSKSVSHKSKEQQNGYTESLSKITKKTSKSNGHKSEKKKEVLKYESGDDRDIISSEQKYVYTNDLGHEYLKDATIHIASSSEDDANYFKSNRKTNGNTQILHYINSTHNISGDLQSDSYKSLKENLTESCDDNVALNVIGEKIEIPRKNNSKDNKIASQQQLKFSKSAHNFPIGTSENVSKETIDDSLNELGAAQDIMISSGNENKIRISPAPKHVSNESYVSGHESFESAGSVISPRKNKTAKNTISKIRNKENVHKNIEAVICSQDIFHNDENIDSSDSEVEAVRNQHRDVSRSKDCNDNVKSSQANKIKCAFKSSKQLSNISTLNSSCSYYSQDNKTDKLLPEDNRQENEKPYLLKGSKSSVRQDPYCAQLFKKNDIFERETSQYLSSAKDKDSNASQNSRVSPIKKNHSRHKCNEKIWPNETTRNINTTVVTATDHSNYCNSSNDSTGSIVMLQKENHDISVQSKDHHKGWYNLSQSSTYSIKTRRKIHKTKRKPSRKHKALKSKDVYGSEICLNMVKANNANSTNERFTAESSEEDNAEPCAKLLFRQKVLKREFKSSEFTITCTGDERAIAIEDGEGGVDMMIEKNTDMKLSSLLPWEDMKKLLCKRTGKLESYITSATEATEGHFTNTYKEISASRQKFLKNYLQRLSNETKETEEIIKELNKQEEKFTKVCNYVEHAYQRQAALEENLESRFSAQKSLFQSPKMALQQKDEKNVLEKYTESLQKELVEMQNHYFEEEYNEIKNKMQQRLMVSLRIEDMDA